ncbi:hypothetical protein EJB05_49029, partial [Eragrostis curvula]
MPRCKFVGADANGNIRRLSENYEIEFPTWSDLQIVAKKFPQTLSLISECFKEKVRKVGAYGIAHKIPSGRQALTSSSTLAPITTQHIGIGFYNDMIETPVTSPRKKRRASSGRCAETTVHNHHLVEDGELKHLITALLQLCINKRSLVFQIHHADVTPDALKDFLTCP